MTIALDLCGVFAQIGEIGDHDIDPPHVVLGEHDPRVDDQDAVVVLEQGHVLADFPQTTEGDDAECFSHMYLLSEAARDA